MPRLANERHELYASYRAKNMLPKKAAIAAGFAQGSAIYTSLEQDGEVQARIAELTDAYILQREQRRAAAMEAAKVVGNAVGLSKGYVLQRLAELSVAAQSEGDYGAALSAVKLIGEEYGMFKGGSSAEEDKTGEHQTVNLDDTERLLNAANISMVPEITEAPEAPFDFEGAMKLIEGNKRQRVPVEDRQLTTGSETDVALRAETAIEDADDNA